MLLCAISHLLVFFVLFLNQPTCGSIFIVEILNIFLGITLHLKNLQRIPVYQRRSKILLYLWFFKISIRSKSQSGDLHWLLRKPCLILISWTNMKSFLIYSFTNSSIHTSANFKMSLLSKALLWSWERTFNSRWSPTWGTQISLHLSYFSWRPFSLCLSIEFHFINPMLPVLPFNYMLPYIFH